MVKIQKPQKCPQIDKWIRETQCICAKEQYSAICNHKDGPNGYCAKQNKSERGRQIPYYAAYMWNLKMQNKGTEK